MLIYSEVAVLARFIKRMLVIYLIVFGTLQNALAFDWEERRRDQFGQDFRAFVDIS